MCDGSAATDVRFSDAGRAAWEQFVCDELLQLGPARETHLAKAMQWWRSEWGHKNREAEWLWRVCFALAVLCGVCFFVGTLLG